MSPTDSIEQASELLKKQQFQEAKTLLNTITKATPEYHHAWYLLAQSHKALNEPTGYQHALKQYEMIAWFNQRLAKAHQHLVKNELSAAESITQELLRLVANEYRALIMLGNIAFKANDLKTYIAITSHNLTVNNSKPSVFDAHIEALFNTKQFNPLVTFYQQAAKQQTLTAHSISLVAASYVKLMAFADASSLYTYLLNSNYHPAYCNLRLGNIEKILGNSQQAIQFYQQAIKLDPNIGEAYWNLANLKTYIFSQHDITNLKQQTTQSTVDLNHALLHFALAKAYDQQQQYDDAFTQLKIANKMQRSLMPHQPNNFKAQYKQQLTKEVINKVTTRHNKDSELQLIFIVSLPRSGSTLVEQILASHQDIDASYELSIINTLANELENSEIVSNMPYKLDKLDPSQRADLAQRYLNFIAPLRTNKPYFIDKQPINFQHIALIKALFPTAKIVDVRRCQAATAWSLYKHSFSEGHHYSYDLADLADYINQHKSLMEHWHQVFENDIHTIHYEDLITHFHATVDELLAYCDLSKQSSCYEFYKNRRPVLTPSSEQVRKPIYKDALTDWQNYADHLAPLLEKLN
ncbi:tetratricopeptide repeat-containing sulfotransferase family protein [Pseudoalteromonas mariniglutinosa]|uniref:tetratricopeptide repeat-containing sulfotransferase family protein n=1 Tax=Pseudoalteromonas mariniglutinosa TaxID=206042 RepID=UPI00384E4BA0